MRTKTPTQIFDQLDRITDTIFIGEWDKLGHVTQESISKVEKLKETALRYIDNIYKIYNVDWRYDPDTKKVNYLSVNAATPVMDYII